MQRLGKNLGGYFGERIDIAKILRQIETAALEGGWVSTTFHSAGGFKWLGLQRTATSGPPVRVYISTGIHGDEPAGPLAALRLLQENRWPKPAEIVFCPCLNPVGFAANTRTNEQGIDLNRDYLHFQSAEIRAHVAWLEAQPRFDLALCLHEDWESQGFYVYELNPDAKPSLAEAIVAGVEPVCPIDFSETIEGRPAAGGIIRPNLDPQTRPQWPEAFWLISHKTRLSYTLEAPSDFPLGTRVDALVAAVNAALAKLA
ncbi:MAG TPA: M14 family metallocarboxypeptidase [Verrucomicrobiae bacterium]|nr:M14 family metallocarboxypeptidase [Verrucomicrobiae bacterium]